jgi:hypothetical protein
MRDYYPSASQLSKVGKLRKAHQFVDRRLALASRLTQSYPGQAASYMFLSEGYIQRAKIAYREDDDSVIERWERKALDSAIHASLEPENQEAQSLVKDCCARLRKLASK